LVWLYSENPSVYLGIGIFIFLHSFSFSELSTVVLILLALDPVNKPLSFSAMTLLVGSSDTKVAAEMTHSVSSGMLNSAAVRVSFFLVSSCDSKLRLPVMSIGE